MIIPQKFKQIVIGYLFLGSFAVFSQKIDLAGTVISMYGNPIPGLTVTLGKAQMKDTTDAMGRFHFKGDGNTSIVSRQKNRANYTSNVTNFILMNNIGQLTPCLSNHEPTFSGEIYDLRGKAIKLRGTEKQLSRSMAPGIYLMKQTIDAGHFSLAAVGLSNTSLDNLEISFKNSVRQTVSVEKYIDTLNIQLGVKIQDRWPQVHAGDSMPLNPGLKVGPYVTGVKTSIDNDGYMVMLIGPERPSGLTDELARNRIADLEKGLREVIEIVGFPAFPEWEKGFFLNWVILNSGIPGATLPNNGGHQGNRWGHMNFEATPHNPLTWSTYEAGGALHECVHALIAELWVYNNRASGWIHEAFNNYLTTMANALVRKKYTIGWTATLHLNMPHIPVETMGLATDDHVAGPADQGMNGRTYHSTQHRYGGEIFFLSLAQVMGRGFNVSLFMEPERNSSKSILQVFHSIYGDEAYAAAIMSYAAKGAILDFEEWTETMRDIMRSHWNNNYWFYMFPGGDGTTTFFPPAKTTPHHQGRNVIPIKLNSGATSVTVEFNHDAKGSKGTVEKMQAQIVYRDKNDTPVYGPVFSKGQHTLNIKNGVRNGIVNLVVAVVHPNAKSGSDDGSGKGFDAQEHFSYKARIVSGGTIAPNTTRPW
ncbi:MAG: DUF6055 domain-containing protein [Chitinispirillia bacterium]